VLHVHDVAFNVFERRPEIIEPFLREDFFVHGVPKYLRRGYAVILQVASVVVTEELHTVVCPESRAAEKLATFSSISQTCIASAGGNV
jgi:hypothetical protein